MAILETNKASTEKFKNLLTEPTSKNYSYGYIFLLRKSESRLFAYHLEGLRAVVLLTGKSGEQPPPGKLNAKQASTWLIFGV